MSVCAGSFLNLLLINTHTLVEFTTNCRIHTFLLLLHAVFLFLLLADVRRRSVDRRGGPWRKVVTSCFYFFCCLLKLLLHLWWERLCCGEGGGREGEWEGRGVLQATGTSSRPCRVIRSGVGAGLGAGSGAAGGIYLNTEALGRLDQGHQLQLGHAHLHN